MIHKPPPEKTVSYEMCYKEKPKPVLSQNIELKGVFNSNMLLALHVTRMEIVIEPFNIVKVNITYREFKGDETQKVLENPNLQLACKYDGETAIIGWLRILKDDWYRLKDDNKRATQGT